MTQLTAHRRKSAEINYSQALLLLIEAFVGRLSASMGCLCRLANISIRQGSYWTKQGHLKCVQEKHRYPTLDSARY